MSEKKDAMHQKREGVEAKAISEPGLEAFVEDSPGVRGGLREHCRDCKIPSPSEARRI